MEGALEEFSFHLDDVVDSLAALPFREHQTHSMDTVATVLQTMSNRVPGPVGILEDEATRLIHEEYGRGWEEWGENPTWSLHPYDPLPATLHTVYEHTTDEDLLAGVEGGYDEEEDDGDIPLSLVPQHYQAGEGEGRTMKRTMEEETDENEKRRRIDGDADEMLGRKSWEVNERRDEEGGERGCEQFACAECGMNCTNRKALWRHGTSTGHLVRDPSRPLRRSSRRDGQLHCDHCPFVTSKLFNLKRHRSSAHEGITFDCPQCGKSFKSETTLRGHVDSVHSSRPSPFDCPHCNSTFATHDNLRKHLRLSHSSSSPSRLCPSCRRVFHSPWHVRRHRPSCTATSHSPS